VTSDLGMMYALRRYTSHLMYYGRWTGKIQGVNTSALPLVRSCEKILIPWLTICLVAIPDHKTGMLFGVD
jgi:hypothetical protein